MTPEEIADSKDLLLAAVYEAIEYCKKHIELLKQEAQEERRYLEERGVVLDPPVVNR